jgi:putative Ca2+/H+ antiporter (TMEM165/GDT1 family)
MILATEIGDKTFFIAAVLSMKHDRMSVFAGAIAALILMTILSTALGLVLPKFLDRKYTHLLSGILFLYFGIKLVIDSRSMEAGHHSEELEEVEQELLQQSSKKKGDKKEVLPLTTAVPPSGNIVNNNNNNGTTKGTTSAAATTSFKNSVLLTALSLTFVAEWGDRSQIATIALASAKNPVGVTIGGILGHCICTASAVLGGRMLASNISEKTVSQWGGIVFLIFGIHSIFWEE